MANYPHPELVEFKLSTNEVVECKPDVFVLKLELDTLGENLSLKTDSDPKMIVTESKDQNDSISMNVMMMLDHTAIDTNSSLDEFDEDDISYSLTMAGQANTLGELESVVGTCEEIESILHRELEVVRTSNKEISSKLKTDVVSLQQQLQTLQENVNNLTAERNEFQQEIKTLRQKCNDNEGRYKTELENLKKELQNQAALNDQLHVKIKEINDKAIQIEVEVKRKKKKGLCACLS
ncbi:uncharacterized protein LOC129370759 [Poeciliopsis prolifica]|uniref:uncharacterized protein LOC129370759 n=1 Tax=Poeciliopsis prolifica TaxID=188132 RepID=UPI002413CA60|nr:uncharacterized protein LOC129370759 [Poeciliopsis prolifica]